MAPHSVRVNAICPGGIVTPMVTAPMPGGVPPDAARRGLATFQPIPRAGEPEDIARAALWLASDESTFVTGHALVVDGGFLAGTRWDRQPPAFRQRPG
jgi:NAD(P)-dependent dehydrogenase (short-subunit alcohol dehydrogenase family)